MEKEGVQKSKAQQNNQSAGVSGNVSATLWGGDLDGNPAIHQETEDFRNEMTPGHCGCDSGIYGTMLTYRRRLESYQSKSS